MIELLQSVYRQRKLLLVLAKRDYLQQNRGTVLGSLWNYLQPFLFVAVLVFIFSVGFRADTSSDGVPFSVYLVTGIIPWLFFANNLNGMTEVIRSYSFLVKKVDFNLAVLPIVKLLSSFPIHLVLVVTAVLLVSARLDAPSLYAIQLFYYFLAMVLLLTGFGLLTSSLSLFFRDISNSVQVLTLFGFWLTPILWDMEKFSPNAQAVLKLNPMAYVVEGYRGALYENVWFWEKPTETLLFWLIVALVLVAGNFVFARLQPHFPEVV